MNFQDLPLFRTSLKLVIYWGFIVDKNWRRYAAIIPAGMMNISQIGNVILSDEHIDARIRDVYFVVVWFNTLIRTLLLTCNRHRYEVFLKDLAIAYEDIQHNESEEVNKMLVVTSKYASRLEKVNFILGVLISVGFFIYPLSTSVRTLPYGVYVPGVDKYASPWYEMVIIFQILVTIPGFAMYIPFTNLVVSFIMFGILMNKVLQNHLSKLKDLKPKQVYPEIVWCVRYQLQIIRYVELVNGLTSYIFLAEFLTCGALLCALLFLVNMVSGLAQLVIVLIYIIMILAQISALYWYANELYHQSIDVAFEAYNTNWFDFDLRSQKALLMLITRTQKPCAILVGNVYPMTLELFQSLLNTSYSYFTLLRRFYE